MDLQLNMEQLCSDDRISPFDMDPVNTCNALVSENTTSSETHINATNIHPTILPNSHSNQIHAPESFRPSMRDYFFCPLQNNQ